MSIPMPAQLAQLNDGDDIIQRARDLVPSLRERAAGIAEERTIPADVMNDLYEAGLMELLRPARFGGQDWGMDLVVRIGRALSYGDGATAWVYLVTAAHDVFVPLFPEPVQAEYWNSERPVGASSYFPTGKVAPADGGFTLSGKWSFCSGIDHAGWVLLGGIAGMTETGPDFRYFLVPAKDYEIVDDWYVMGLRGTGSKSVQLNDVFVPAGRVITESQVTEGVNLGRQAGDQPDYRESVWLQIGYSLAAPATGIAQAAYEAVVADLRMRMGRGDPVFMARKQTVQAQLGEISALINASNLVFTQTLNDTFAVIDSHVRLNDSQRCHNRRDVCYSVKLALQAAEKLMSVAGASGLRESHPVQRALRDLYAISSHPAVNFDAPAISFGSTAMGFPPTETKV